MVSRTISVCLGENVPNYDFIKKLLLQFLSFFFSFNKKVSVPKP